MFDSVKRYASLENYLSRGYQRINNSLRRGGMPLEAYDIDALINRYGIPIDFPLYRSLTPPELDINQQLGFLSTSENTSCALFSKTGRATVTILPDSSVVGLHISSLFPGRAVESEILLPRGLFYKRLDNDNNQLTISVSHNQ